LIAGFAKRFQMAMERTKIIFRYRSLSRLFPNCCVGMFLAVCVRH